MIRILVVDDHPEVRSALALLLSLEPEFEVVGMAGNGLEAIEQARSLMPDAIVMDYKMPVIDGFTAAKRILSEQPNMVVVTMALRDEAELPTGGWETGEWIHLTKPIAAEILNAAIWSALDTRR
jgi:DNA-binding NarL/FixJ family response regulator